MERIRMDRVNAILKHKTYRKYYDQIEKIEKDRIFCRHQMPHLLDVARIAYIGIPRPRPQGAGDRQSV